MSQPRRLFAALILIVAIAGVAEAEGRLIVPVVGSTAGVNGANFRTEMQLHNPGTGVMRGSLMFLPQSTAPQAGALATLGYELGPKQTLRYADVLATMGSSGLGSLDILPLEGGRPRVVVRAFDDQGNFGTRGLVIPALEESEAPVIGYRFVLVAPADAARYRFNIGVRTLGESSTTFRVVEHDSAGAPVGEPIMLEYAGESFRQQPAELLLGRSPVAGHTYSFEALSGSAFVYATTVDNQTNDGSLQLDRPVNRPPVVSGATVTTGKNQPVTITIPTTDPDDDPMTFQIISVPSHGRLSELPTVTKTPVQSGVEVVYTPATDYQGPDMFTVLVADDVNGRTFATIVINVGTQTGDAPTAVNDRYTMNEGATLNVGAPGVLANDTDPEGNTLVAQLVQGPGGAATFKLNADGSFTYRPRAGYYGGDIFQYTASDGTGVSNVARVTIIVNSTNDAPVANADAAATTEDAAIGISVLANDSDPEGAPLTVSSVNTTGTLGAVSIGAGGVINYNPTGSATLQTLAAGATRDDTFAYTIRDPRSAAATTTVTVTVTGVDDAPLAVADSTTLLEDAAATAIAVLANDTDIDGGPLSIVSVTQGTTGTVVITGGGTGVTFQPNANACGSDSFTYSLNGGSTATVSVTVTCVNDAPSFAAGGDATVLEDSGSFTASPWATGVSAGPANEAAQALTFAVTNDNNALFSAQPAVDAAGNLTFTPAANANGSAAITVTLSDDGGTADGGVDSSASQTFNITVTAVNDAPAFVKDSDETVLEDSGLHTVAGWATSMSKGPADESGQTLSFVVTNDNNALFSVQPAVDPVTGTLTYTLAADAAGVATVSVTLQDDGGTANGGVDSSAAETLKITVTDVNDAPSFTKGGNAMVLEDSGAFTASPWATGVGAGPASESGQVLTFAVTNDNNGLFSAQPAVDASGNLTFTPAPNANGIAVVTVGLSDDGGTVNGGVDTAASQTFNITVTAVNDAPVFTRGADESVNEDTGAHSVAGWATAISAGPADESGQTLTFGVTNDNNTLFSVQPAVDASGNLSYTLAADQFGSATLSVTLSDDGGVLNGGVDTSDAQAFTINVANVNDDPTDIALSNATVAEALPAGTVVGTLSTTDVDAGNTFTYTLVAGAGSADNASFQIAGDSLQTGAVFDFETKSSYSIRVRTTDSAGGFFEEVFAITVTDGNETPTDLALSNATVAETQAAGTAVGNLSTTDPDAGDTFSYTLVAGAGDTGNASFQIVGGQLQTAAILDFETQASYSVRIRTTDAGGLFYEEAFTITVTDANETPTDMALSNDSVQEGEPAGTAVGNLTTTDPDAGDTFTYTLVAGTGSADNASFQISSAQLQTAAVLNYNTQTTYSVRVRTTDAGGLFYEEAFTINLIDVNVDPTDIALDNASVAENQASGAAVGNLTTTDPDAGDTHTYTLVAGAGSTDNGSFQISGAQLLTAAPLDFETKSSYSVRIRTTDGGGLFYEEAFTIAATNANETPTDMALDNATIDENMPAATVVGTLSTTDPDAGDTFTYTLAAGAGSTDNASFQISGTQLQSAASFDFETKSSYSIRIRTTDAGGLFYEEAFTITIGNVSEAPVATADTFDTIGNTLLEVDAASSEPAPKVYVNGNLLANDVDPDTGTNAGLTTALLAATAGAVVTVNSDGTFTYLPPAGHVGATDTFTYTLSDADTLTNTGLVTITLLNRVWYVDPSGAAGDGRSSAPFNTLNALDGVGGAGDSDVTGDYIFVRNGTLALAGPMEMEANQHLVGEGVGLSIPVNPNGTGSPWVGLAAGTQPQLTNATGDAVTITTAIPVEIVGLSLASTTGNTIDLTSAAALTGSATLTLGDNTIRGAGAEGIDVNMNAGTTGTLAVNVTNNSWNIAGTHTGNAIDVNRVAGTVQLNLSNNTNIVSSGAGGINVVGGSVANTFFTGFANNTVHQNTAGTGISISNATFDVTPLGAYQQVSGGATVVGTPGDGVGTSGVVLNTVNGDLAFADLDIYASNGSGLVVSGSGVVNTGAGTGTRITVVAGAGIIEATGGPAVSLSSMTTDLQLASLKSANSATTGVALTNVGDGTTNSTVSAATGSSITSATGTDFAISGGNATVTYNGTITDDTGQLVSVASATGDTLSFTGAISDGDDGDGSGISLTSNGAATITFSGGVVLSTGGNAAFTATGGGTVNVCDENPCNAAATGSLVNKITTTTGLALNVANTTVGSGSLEFQSISSNGAPNGIVLNTTGSTAGLQVKGTGSAGTGGTIQGSTGAAVLLTSVNSPVSLSYLNIQNGGDDGIRGATVNGLNLTNVSITGNGNAVGEWGIDLTQLTGSGSMSNCTVSGSAENNVVIANTSGTLSAFNVTGSSFTTTNMTTGDDGFRIENNGTGSMTVSITGSTFTDSKGDHFQAATSAGASGALNVTFSNNTLSTTAGNDPNVIGGGITLSPSGSADMTFTLNGNNIQQAFDEAINLNLGTASTAAASMIGTVSNNIVGTAGTVDSGSESGSGISVISNGAGLTTVSVTGNQVFQYANPYGILLNIKEGSTSMNATVTGNTVSNPGSFALNGIRVDAGATAGDSGTLCATISGNSVAGSGPGVDTDIRLRQRFNTTIRLPGYAGANNDTAAVNSFVAGNNTGSDVSSAHNVGGGGGGFVGGAACPTP